MSDDVSKQLTAAMTRLASLEAEVSGYRSRKAEPTFDPSAFRAQLVSDPMGTLTKMGVPVDHVTRVLVANAMGDQAPAELKVLAQMGPTVSATHTLNAQVENLSRQLASITEREKSQGTRESFKALAKDKTKYPHLAKALSADPEMFNESIGAHRGTAEDFAKAQEAHLSKVASVYGIQTPPASDGNADTEADPSMQVKPALASTMGGAAPLPKEKAGVFTQEDHAALRDEIIRKYTSQQK